MATYEKNQLYQVPLAELQPDPSQPRKYMDPAALDELTASISQRGIIEPVVCRQDPATGLVFTVAGERRCAAARKANLPTVPVVFIDGTDCAEVALVENLLRQDLNPVEEAEALKRLMDDHAYEQAQLATVIGKSQSNISKSLSLNRLPKEIRDECRQDPSVPKAVLLEIACRKQERSMLTQFRKFREQQATEAAKAAGEAPALVRRSRTKAEAIAGDIGAMANKICDLEFPDFSEADRTMIIESMNFMKETLDEALPRAVANKKRPT
ncbi:MAG: ParB/RepB/Spo0J family partition protein [Deltaproteobacteria bacterium]|nr:ParB/RepB/Spo0J family partition protein [Deltaproteobacteria bacterium]